MGTGLTGVRGIMPTYFAVAGMAISKPIQGGTV